MIKMVSFMLSVLHHIKKKKERRKAGSSPGGHEIGREFQVEAAACVQASVTGEQSEAVGGAGTHHTGLCSPLRA